MVQKLNRADLSRELSKYGLTLPTVDFTVEQLLAGAEPVVQGMKESDQPVVMGIGAAGALEACKFALLTGRALQIVPRTDDLIDNLTHVRTARSLLIAPGLDFDSELLHTLSNAMQKWQCDIAHGWLYPFGLFERDYALLKCVIYGRTGPPEVLPFRFIYPLEPTAEVVTATGDRWIFGTALSPSECVQFLQEPTEFLAITGHSNGVDMGAGSAVLCPRDSTILSNATRVLPCFNGAPCSRKNSHNDLCQASSVRCSVALLYTCWGAVLQRHIYDIRGSLLFNLVKSPSLSVVITTYASILMDSGASVTFAQRYGQRVPIGQAVQQVNAEHFRSFHDVAHALLLFGDPEQRCAHQRVVLDDDLSARAPIARILRGQHVAADRSSLDTHRANNVHDSIAVQQGRLAAVNHLRAIVSAHRALRLPALESVLPQLSQMLERLWLRKTRQLLRHQQFDAKCGTDILAKSYGAELKHAQASLFAMFASMVSHLGGLLHLQTDGLFLYDLRSTRWLESICPYCTSSSQRVIQSMAGAEQVLRQLHKCDNCAVVQDGDPNISEAHIVTSATWRRSTGAAFSLCAHVQAESTSRPFIAGVVMEPFLKSRQQPPLQVVQNGVLQAHESILKVLFDASPIPEGTVAGSYFLNALIVVGERHAFLRRTIYLH
ncbi:hypothetical protein [Verminephrobacter aporrectodeae]|uniref:hypothetical protein n=1 Tax=Verminephrobacter aporrectodeae TaxID=1110389 RepID=UPI0022388A61|nr:hypothetical protein [Verminephrobacter aporrectodeae]